MCIRSGVAVLSAVAVAAACSADSPPGDPAEECTAEDAASNVAGQPLKATAADAILPGELYAVYSAIGNPLDGAVDNNSVIYVLSGTGSDVLIFGMGYGNPGGDATYYRGAEVDALADAAADVAVVDRVVTSCMGRTRDASVTLVVPHMHLDHVNQEFVSALEALGYGVERTLVHTLDENGATCGTGTSAVPCCGAPTCNPSAPAWGTPYDPPWTSETLASFETIGTSGDACADELEVFQSTSGEAWSLHSARANHTPGSLNLVGPTAGLFVMGAADTACQPPPGASVLRIHGNVVLP